MCFTCGPLLLLRTPGWSLHLRVPALSFCAGPGKVFSSQLQYPALLAPRSGEPSGRLSDLERFSISPGSAGSTRVCLDLWAQGPECRGPSTLSQPAVEDTGQPRASLSDAAPPALQQLQLLGRFCQEQGIPFPPISPSPEEQQQPRECHLFLDPDCPEAPAVLHFPLVNDSFREHSAPGEPAWPLLRPTSTLSALSKATPAPPPSASPPYLAALSPLQGSAGQLRRRRLGR